MLDKSMEIDLTIRKMISEEIDRRLEVGSGVDPILIKIKDVAELCKVDRSIIDELVHAAPANGFPAVRLSKQTVVIDQARLYRWLNAGGLKGITEAKDAKKSTLRLAS